MDLSYAYRFGPPACDLVVVELDTEAAAVSPAFHFPIGLPRERELDVGLAATAVMDGDAVQLTLTTRRFAQSVAIECDGFVAADDFVHIAPGSAHVVTLRRDPLARAAPSKIRGTATALNSEASARFEVLP